MRIMIELSFIKGDILTFSVNDWSILRKEYRIIGEIIGNSTFIPSLPVKILPEEAFMLLENSIVEIKEIICQNNDPVIAKDTLEKFEKSLFDSQLVEYKKYRKLQLESIIDKIVEKKRKLNDNRSSEEILNEELEKSTVICRENMLWPILLKPLNMPHTETKIVTSEDVLKQSTKLKCLIYSDLWKKGYYITQGDKFGGDFLVYLGDPVCHHAIFIVRCINLVENISPSEIVAFGRLGTSVKKRAVLASLLDDKVSYITINWIDA